jgi:hypothetical protein
MEYSMNNYSAHSVASRHRNDTSSPYLGAEPRSYSEPRVVHLPHWADVHHSSSHSYASSNMGLMNGNSTQLQVPDVVGEANGLDYDPYSALRKPLTRQDTLLSCVPNSSSFLLEAQQNPRYNASDFRSVYALVFLRRC